jgi:hypothetical protein
MRESTLAQPHAIPVRFLDRPPSRATVRGAVATWACVCANRRQLEGGSGEVGGPTPDTMVVCPDCGRGYFVIPVDRSYSAAIEVIELSRFCW